MDRPEERAGAICIPGVAARGTIPGFACPLATPVVVAQQAAPLQGKPRLSEEKDLTRRAQSAERRGHGETAAKNSKQQSERASEKAYSSSFSQRGNEDGFGGHPVHA